MPIIGLYIAAASLACSFAMAADVRLAFRQKKFWMPCKYFTINAASLTLLTVAVKLPLDLSTSMPGCIDQLAKLSGTVFMCTAMANFLPFVGSMNDRDLLVNLAAMGILVVTLSVNIIIQLSTGVIRYLQLANIQSICFMLLMLVILSFSAVAAPTTKKHLELKYNELHKRASNVGSEEHEMLSFEKLKERLRVYWVMAESGDPQFVIARSVTCFTSAWLCFTSSVFLLSSVSNCFANSDEKGSLSDYEWSTYLILVIQYICTIIGTIAPASRLVVLTSVSCTKICTIKFKTESYWTQRLIEWKEKPLGLQMKSPRCRKHMQSMRNQMLNLCIKLEKFVVLLSKLIQTIFSVSVMILLWPCFCFFWWYNKSEAQSAMEQDLSSYVLLLEGEDQLPKRWLKKNLDSYSGLIQKGAKKQPRSLLKLLETPTSFMGVADFDNDQVRRLNLQEPPNCWTLPIVTLTSIAIALPKVRKDVASQFIQGVVEGLSYARIIERSLRPEKTMLIASDAASVVWVEVELYRRWLDNDLQKMARKSKTCKEVLERLAENAEEIVMSFKRNMGDGNLTETSNWPAKVLAANSMYRISRTLLLEHENSINLAGETLFQRISYMVADILSACLTNLPRVIMMKCYSSTIEERGKSVGEAAALLGETADILRLLQQSKLPDLSCDNTPYIEAWRALIKHQSSNSTSRIVNHIDADGSGELRLDIET